MKVRRLSVGLKFSMAVTVIIVATMVGVATLIINYQRDSLRQSTFESANTMTRNLANDAIEPLLMFDPLRLDELVRTMHDAASCTYAMILDREGVIVAHSRRALLGSTADTGGAIAEVDAGADGIVSRDLAWEDIPVREFSVPIRIGSHLLGLARVGFSLESIDTIIETRLARLKRYIYLIAGIMVLGGIAGAFLVSSILTKPITKLKNKMADVQAGNLDVEMENPLVVNCWERLGCEKRDCPAYGKKRCWAIAGTFCHGTVQGEFAQKIGDCRKCVVYRESCGDEVHELIEVFNQMVKDLKYNLSELEKANTEKAKMERLSALGEMATTVAHETKNPLNSIRLATSYLKKNFQGEILTEFLTIIEEEIRRLNDITSNFLGFSRPAPLNLKMCDLNAIVRPVVELIRQEATDRNIEVVLLTDEHLPPVQCDLSRLKQAVLNLLVNAMDVSKEGDRITVLTEQANGRVMISVQDTGPGIADGDREKIFKPFYTTKTRGSGLGLAIVDRIVKEHSGEIQVDSAAGEGTKFTLKIPAQEHVNV